MGGGGELERASMVGTAMEGAGAEVGGSVVRVRVGFLDWDEARVDHPWLDLADVPGLPVPGAAKAAVDAWEVANAWVMEPTYARQRLARLAVDKSVDNRPGCG